MIFTQKEVASSNPFWFEPTRQNIGKMATLFLYLSEEKALKRLIWVMGMSTEAVLTVEGEYIRQDVSFSVNFELFWDQNRRSYDRRTLSTSTEASSMAFFWNGLKC